MRERERERESEIKLCQEQKKLTLNRFLVDAKCNS